MVAVGVRARFEDARRAIKRMDEINLAIMYGLDDWKPEGVRSKSGTDDPTASKAIRDIDEVQPTIRELMREREDCERVIGEALALIESVRVGLGERYAVVLDCLYIDGMTWRELRQAHDIPKSTGQQLRNVAFDWMDSVGISRLLKGETEV